MILPDFVPAPAEGFKMMPAAGSVPDELFEASAAAAENDASMQATTCLDPVKTRLLITRNLRFESLAAARRPTFEAEGEKLTYASGPRIGAPSTSQERLGEPGSPPKTR